MAGRIRYGIDGWPYLLALSTIAVTLSVTAAALARRRALAVVAASGAFAAAIPAGMGLRYVWRGKLVLRDLLLDAVTWRGDEVVVDLGAGAGLLAIGAARRTIGPVHVVDLFVGKDLSGNAEDRLVANAVVEGVSDRIIVHRNDVQATDLPDNSIDVALSTLCLHNLAETRARAVALDEVIRILRPGGHVAFSDLAHIDEYAAHLRAAGFIILRTGPVPGSFPPQRFFIATAPSDPQ